MDSDHIEKMEQARETYKRAIEREESAARILRRAQAAVSQARRVLEALNREHSERVSQAYRNRQLQKASRKAVEGIARVFS